MPVERLKAPTAYNRDDLDLACTKFRAACAEVEAHLPAGWPLPYRGSFEEVEAALAYIPFSAEGVQLRDRFNLANQRRNNEAKKVGMTEPQGWYYCWGLTP